MALSREEVSELSNISLLLGTDLYEPVELEQRRELTNIERTICDRTGSERFLLVSVKRVSIGSGSVLFVCRDATERRQAQMALAQERSRLLAVFERLPEFVCVQASDYSIRFSNRSFRQLFGEPGDRPCYEVIAGRDTPCENCPTFRVFESRQPQHWEWTSGTGRTYVVHDVPFADTDGSLAVLEIGVDITQRKQAEAALRAERDRAQTYLDVAGVMFVALDRQGSVILVNRKACEILGYPEGELIGKNWFETCLPEEARSDVRDVFAKLMAGETQPVEYYENAVLTHDGQQRIIAWHNALLRDDAGNLIGTLGSGEDITESRRLREQLLHSQKMEAVGTLAGGVAHDFNNLLQGMLGYLDLAAQELGQGHATYADLKEVERAADQAAQLTRQLLAFSRRQAMRPVPLDLNSVIEGLMKLLRRVIGEHIELVTVFGHDLKTIHADAGQIEQVVVNLCVNARDAMPEGGVLTIETDNVRLDAVAYPGQPGPRGGEWVELTISDNGRGMSQEVCEHIFEPFFTTKEVGKGTGLGLATVYGIVQQHEGTITVDSEPGRGTTFLIRFPARQESGARSYSINAPAPSLRGSETVLLAEDDELVRRWTMRALENAGYRVLWACDGQEAIEIFEQHVDEIDLALLDVVMPKRGGRAVLEAIHKRKPEVVVLLMSGYGRDSLPLTPENNMDTMLIHKPMHSGELLKRLREALGKSKTPAGPTSGRQN